MSRFTFLLFMPLALLRTCNWLVDGSDHGSVRIQADRSAYAVGDTIEAVVFNEADRSYFFANCCGPILLHLEIRQDSSWLSRPGTCIALCNSVPTEVHAGQSRVVLGTYLPSLSDPGEYRLTASYWREPKANAPALQASSDPFTIELE